MSAEWVQGHFEENLDAFKIMTVIRHPWDRLTSGLHNPYDDERPFAQKIEDEILSKPSPHYIDPHLRPQWVLLKDFEVDLALRFDNLDREWDVFRHAYPDLPALEHRNEGPRHDWRTMGYDFSPLMDWYGPDFDLCTEWER